MRFITCAVACVLGLIAEPSAHAILIDTFDDGIGMVTALASGPLNVSATSAVGGSRTLSVSSISGGGSFSASTNLVSLGVFDVSSGVGTVGTATILYNANGAGLGGVSLASPGGKLGLAVQQAQPNPVKYALTLTETALAGGSSHTVEVTTSMSTLLTFGLNSFTGAGVDITSIDSIKLDIITTVAGTDVEVNFITSDVVPEPSSLGLSLIALGAMVGWRRRRTTKKAIA